MVAAAHPDAVRVGAEVLRGGGSAVDAAIAVNAALGVCEPTACGIGGDLFALVWDGALHGLNASGRAPAKIDVKQMRLDGPESWTVPGCVDGWFELHARFGRRPMRELLAPAIRMAREGVAIPPVIASHWRPCDKPGFAETFTPANPFRNPTLADTYSLLVERDAFYHGPIAEEIVDFSRVCRGFFTMQDFEDHRSDWVPPISTDYRGATVWELGPNTQGATALQMLNMMETFDLRAMGRDSADFWHAMVEIKKLAFEDRATCLADITKPYARRRAALIDMKRAAERVTSGFEGGTTYIAVGDEGGMMVSLIQSNYTGFGSGYCVSGFGLQNRGALFNLDASHPNCLAPRKRPFHTIIPAFATRGGEPWLAFGVMGGAFQPQGHAQILANLLDFDMGLQEAGDAPRFAHDGSSEPTGSRMRGGGVLHLEPGIPAAAELARRGHRIEPGGYFGGYQAVARTRDGYEGASESRKDGVALGY